MIFSQQPDISIILPTFNRAQQISTAIDSVITQTFSSWELIIVDDGSTDNTCSLVSDYIAIDDRIRYMKHSNRLPAMSRNAGIQAAMGRYITFLDSDDYYLEDHLLSRFAMMEKNPSTDLLAGGFTGDNDIYVRDCRNMEKLIHISQCILCGTFFGKRSLFIEMEGFKPVDYAEDAEFWERASSRYRIIRITEPATYVYQRANDSITRNR
ncbi:MAG: glycosyl transferase [Prosthecochloris sp.]|uniref:glycosyltransferase family 2 protein n=1 Tax=Prosthecochloris sp. TaxID=290513 RepID=UPI0013CD26C2|nr:glycosyltransferase family A protein [Prosthecochloris sp.]NEX11746.1 glycosyl transferase [Prosthecochloris sp.]